MEDSLAGFVVRAHKERLLRQRRHLHQDVRVTGTGSKAVLTGIRILQPLS